MRACPLLGASLLGALTVFLFHYSSSLRWLYLIALSWGGLLNLVDILVGVLDRRGRGSKILPPGNKSRNMHKNAPIWGQNASILVAISQKISLPWKINNCNIYQIWGKNPCFCTKFKNCPMCLTLLKPIYGRQSRCTGSNHKGANVLYKFLGRKMIFLEIFMSLAGHSSVWSPNVATFPAQRKYFLVSIRGDTSRKGSEFPDSQISGNHTK